MRTELRAIQKRVGITFIYITHDQGEALTMSDRIAVMNAGHVEQIGDGRQVYDHPATPFVASFVGENNGVAGIVQTIDEGVATLDTPLGALQGRAGVGLAPGQTATLFVRPEQLRIAGEGQGRFGAEVVGSTFEGNLTHIALRGCDGRPLTMSLGRHLGASGLSPGDRVGVDYSPEEAIALAGAAS